ncbi:MAG: hypothetical protein VX740_11250 [Pseudomonadota bacterium]|nr:hypothetical protein [Pseudomonadota bacterium]MEC7701643.1 hypothetical protein [Pseudomonadota bacterium]MED5424005.1 hypothetical protein [Pseudomonadota bacterium]MEE3322873.1 hypothetical protein [Pseudomonadota bacterium]
MAFFKNKEEREAIKRAKQEVAADKLLTKIFNTLSDDLRLNGAPSDPVRLKKSVGGSDNLLGFAKNGFGMLTKDVGALAVEQVKDNKAFQQYQNALNERGYALTDLSTNKALGRSLTAYKAGAYLENGLGIGAGATAVVTGGAVTGGLLILGLGLGYGLSMGKLSDKSAASLSFNIAAIDKQEADWDALELDPYETLAEVQAAKPKSDKTPKGLIV